MNSHGSPRSFRSVGTGRTYMPSTPISRGGKGVNPIVHEGISGFSGARLCAPVEGLWVAVHTNQKFVRRTYAHMSSFSHGVPLVVHAEPAKLTCQPHPCFLHRHGRRVADVKTRGWDVSQRVRCPYDMYNGHCICGAIKGSTWAMASHDPCLPGLNDAFRSS